MSKPHIHAASSARKFGGMPCDYVAIHEKMDSSKIAHGDITHRCVFHSAFGIFLIEELFGKFITNSDGSAVCVRDVAEQHILEDLGFIPSLSDWLHQMVMQPWMAGEVVAFQQGRKRVISDVSARAARINSPTTQSHLDMNTPMGDGNCELL